MVKFCSWNVNGIRAVAQKGFFQWLEASGFDIVSLQETKAQREQLEESFFSPVGYSRVEFNSAVRKGYSGVADYYKEGCQPREIKFGFDPALIASVARPLKISSVTQDKKAAYMEYAEALAESELEEQLKAFNLEGRVIENRLDLGLPSELIYFNIYFPNGGAGLERLKFKLEFYEFFLVYLRKLLETHPYIVITGDFNTAHHEIDLARPKDNTNVSGFMPIERVYLDRLQELGFVDSFRLQNPASADNYTWWSFRTAARNRNIGWRIDYFFISAALKPFLAEAKIHSDILGSDHCPVSINLDFNRV